MIVKFPNLFNYSIETINEKHDILKSLGFSNAEVLKIFKGNSVVYAYTMENIIDKFNSLVDFGYNVNDIRKIMCGFPQIFDISINNIKLKILGLLEFGLTKEQIIYLTVSLPTIYGVTIENIKQKLVYLESIGLIDVIFKSPKNLMQSAELTFARYEFLKSRGIEVTYDNFRLLFINQNRFKSKFGVSNKVLLEVYDYGMYLMERNESDKLILKKL